MWGYVLSNSINLSTGFNTFPNRMGKITFTLVKICQKKVNS